MNIGSLQGSDSLPLDTGPSSATRQTQRWEDFERARSSLEGFRPGSESGPEKLDSEKQRLKEAANKMEGVLLNVMVKQMRETVNQSDLFQGGRAGKIFQERLDRRYAQTMAQKHEFWIAEAIYRQLSKNLTGG